MQENAMINKVASRVRERKKHRILVHDIVSSNPILGMSFFCALLSFKAIWMKYTTILHHLFRWLHYGNHIKDKSDNINQIFLKKGIPRTGFESAESWWRALPPFALPLIWSSTAVDVHFGRQPCKVAECNEYFHLI